MCLLQGPLFFVSFSLDESLENLTCDHYTVFFNVNICRLERMLKLITLRKFLSKFHVSLRVLMTFAVSEHKALHQWPNLLTVGVL